MGRSQRFRGHKWRSVLCRPRPVCNASQTTRARPIDRHRPRRKSNQVPNSSSSSSSSMRARRIRKASSTAPRPLRSRPAGRLCAVPRRRPGRVHLLPATPMRLPPWPRLGRALTAQRAVAPLPTGPLPARRTPPPRRQQRLPRPRAAPAPLLSSRAWPRAIGGGCATRRHPSHRRQLKRWPALDGLALRRRLLL